MRSSKTFHELQDFFERTVGQTPGVYLSCGSKPEHLRANRAAKKPDGTWPSCFYNNGAADSLFRIFLSGHQYAAAAK